MADRIPRSRFHGRSVVRRQSLWLGIDTFTASLSGSPSAVLGGVFSAVALALRPFTIVRTRGIMFVISDQLAATESYGVGLGLAVVSDQAVAVGITAVPTPLTDKGSDLFFVYEQLFSRFEFRTSVGFESSGGAFLQWDSKAMRKVNDDQDLALTVENEINGVNVTVSGRMLIKLH